MRMSGNVTVAPAGSQADLADAKVLFTEYVQWLDLDLTFQDFVKELDSLPGRYAPPAGELLLARNDQGHTIGCVAVRPLLDLDKVCEMKRLYIRPSGRNLGLGRRLINAIVEHATKFGYLEMRLDTLPSRMQEAISLYKRLGFEEIDAYYETPLDETMFLAKKLR